MKKYIQKDFIKNTNEFISEFQYSFEFLKLKHINWEKDFKNNDKIPDTEKKLLRSNIQTFNTKLETIDKSLYILKKLVKQGTSSSLIKTFLAILLQKKILLSSYREILSFHASMMTSLNWQSPAIKSSTSSRVGNEPERIKADWNDYKRDRSSDTFLIEKYFSKNILPSRLSNTEVNLHLFNSGMAALTTILYFLICENIITNNSVMAWNQIYVETKMLLKKFLPKTISFFSTNTTKDIIATILRKEPKVVFMEPIANTSTLRMLNLHEIIKSLSHEYKNDLYLIIDTTCSFGFDNFLNDICLPPNIKIILHGSLLKGPQMGIERTNAGFIQSYNLEEEENKILDYRTLSGTNIQDFATYLLPNTTKGYIIKRMKLIERNANILASLMKDIDIQNRIIEETIYPGLKNHPDYSLSKKLGFAGFFFNIKFFDRYNNDKYFEQFTQEVISIAKEYNVDIVHGASFGFNITSIYYSVGWDEPENHYIRISTGTESLFEIELIKKVLEKAFQNFCEVNNF